MTMMKLSVGSIKTKMRAKTSTAPTASQIIDINLMPVGRRPLDVAPSAAAVVVALLLCVFAMVPIAFQLHAARSSAAAMEQQASDAERGVKALQLNLARQRGLHGELEGAKAKLAKVEAQQQGLQGGKRPLKDDLTMLFGYGAFLPKGVRVTAISGADHALKVDGTAPGPLDAISYADRLVKSGGFSGAHLTSFAPGTKDGGQFSLQVLR